MIELFYGDNKEILKNEKRKFELIYLDPPFNTGIDRKFKGLSYSDKFSESEFKDMLFTILKISYELLTDNGSLFLHLDNNSKFKAKIWLDKIFGEKNFINEIIWAYDYGARSKKRWAAKHDTIFWYAKNPKNYIFNYENIDRIPYLSRLCGKEKFERGKTPTDVWFMTIEPTNSKNRVNYPTQKPLKLLTRIINTHSNKGDLVGDFFAGSGTTGRVCKILDRNCVLIDKNIQSIEIIKKRLNL